MVTTHAAIPAPTEGQFYSQYLPVPQLHLPVLLDTLQLALLQGSLDEHMPLGPEQVEGIPAPRSAA